MSDEFVRIATQEILTELSSIDAILQRCTSDSDVFLKSSDIEKHLHKIKGLAPMMGKEKVGVISALNDSVLKHVFEGKKPQGIFQILSESIRFMINSMNSKDEDFDTLHRKFKKNFSDFLD